jgi:hypothetical protein
MRAEITPAKNTDEKLLFELDERQNTLRSLYTEQTTRHDKTLLEKLLTIWQRCAGDAWQLEECTEVIDLGMSVSHAESDNLTQSSGALHTWGSFDGQNPTLHKK